MKGTCFHQLDFWKSILHLAVDLWVREQNKPSGVLRHFSYASWQVEWSRNSIYCYMISTWVVSTWDWVPLPCAKAFAETTSCEQIHLGSERNLFPSAGLLEVHPPSRRRRSATVLLKLVNFLDWFSPSRSHSCVASSANKVGFLHTKYVLHSLQAEKRCQIVQWRILLPNYVFSVLGEVLFLVLQGWWDTLGFTSPDSISILSETLSIF